MAIRRLPGMATLDFGVFWEDVGSHDGWRIQFNKTLDKSPLLKPVRLLDPAGNLWASADSIEEMQSSIDDLMLSCSAKDPLIGSDEAKAALRTVLQALVVIVVKRVAEQA